MAAPPRPDAVEIVLVEDNQADVLVLATELLAQARIVSRITVACAAAVAPTPSWADAPAAGRS